jgi:hypothetical protein
MPKHNLRDVMLADEVGQDFGKAVACELLFQPCYLLLCPVVGGFSSKFAPGKNGTDLTARWENQDDIRRRTRARPRIAKLRHK